MPNSTPKRAEFVDLYILLIFEEGDVRAVGWLHEPVLILQAPSDLHPPCLREDMSACFCGGNLTVEDSCGQCLDCQSIPID